MAFGIDDIIGAGLSIINKFIPDTNAQAQAAAEYKLAVLNAQNKAESDQRDIDKVEAASPSIFVAGWRPYVGWVCGISLTYQGLFVPLLSSLGIHMVSVDIGWAQTLLYALLGIGGLRTVDKITGNDTQGVAMRLASAVINKVKGK